MALGGKKQRGELNVTPLVDIVLVLIVIFLVAMPVAMHDIVVDVPSAGGQPAPGPHDPVTVEVRRSGLDGSGHVISVLVDGTDTDRAGLAEVLRTKLEAAHEKVVFVNFDDGTHYGDAVAIMDLAKGAGAANVAIQTK